MTQSIEGALSQSDSDILLEKEDNLFVRVSVPKYGIVSSNQNRIERISTVLDQREAYEVPWGPKIYIGFYKNSKVFMASAPVGSGSGLMFTELYAAGAHYIVRYGSDDVKSPPQEDKNLIKIIDETDNLFGYELASGLDPDSCGKLVGASSEIIAALSTEALERNLPFEKRVCHHLENYHALRTPEKFSSKRREALENQLKNLKRDDKKESFDMESAVLFRVAHDFKRHAASVLQTVDKENKNEGPYEGANKEQALKMEKIFTDYVLSALLRLK